MHKMRGFNHGMLDDVVHMDKETIETYNAAAKVYAQKFADLGAEVRADDIERAFRLVNKKHPIVVELGCGDGRDAKLISQRTPNYVGIDASSGMIALAKQRLPQCSFEISDIATYKFKPGVDIVLAFASLLHLEKESVAAVFTRVYEALNKGGVFHVSVKYGTYEGRTVVTEEHGNRTFYFYTENDFEEMRGEFRIVYREIEEIKGTKWLEMVFQK